MTRLTHGKSKSKVYGVWSSMKSRCTNPNVAQYKDYGDRGITLCKRWRKFENFLSDMGEPEPGETIERIDNNKGYSPDNCKWVTRFEQSKNKRNNRNITINGKTMCMTEWSILSGIKAQTIWARLNKGWSEEDAVFLPIITKREGIPRGEKIHKYGSQHNVRWNEAEKHGITPCSQR